MDKIYLNESRLRELVRETIVEILKEGNSNGSSDRHRDGYYQEYAEKTGKKDRHSPDYYKKYRERKKQEKELSNANQVAKAKKKGKKKDRHRPGYYHDYNIAHPERLERIGIYRDDVSGKLGHFDDDGNFWTFEDEQCYYDMCEDPTMGI